MKFVLFLITCSTICSTIAAEQSPLYTSIHSHDNLYEQEHEYQLKRRRAKESKDKKDKESKDKKSKDDTNYRFFDGVTKFAENGGEDSEIPSSLPSTLPSDSPIAFKSHHPSTRPSEFPSVPPNTLPTITPTDTISTLPTNVPTRSPIVKSHSPSSFPSESPTERPTSIPSIAVSVSPSGEPTLLTALPTVLPSSIPSASPTILASNAPSVVHSSAPSTLASETPSVVQSASPSVTESQNPTSILSNSPSSSLKPSVMPTSSPSSSTLPSLTPTIDPTVSIHPSFQPSETFSMSPSVMPSSEPSVILSLAPTEEKDARSFTLFPSVAPSSNPTDIQSAVPTSNPSETKSSPPSDIHSAAPSTSKNPTSAPSGIHSAIPSSTIKPSAVPSTTPTSAPASWCKNSEISFPVTNQNGKTSDKTCSWVDNNTDKRCGLEGVRNNCPVSCNYCLCKDNPDVFSTKLSNSLSCQWVGKNLSTCSSVPKAEFNCPLTCGKCTEAPSIAPSSKPSSESPSKAPSVSPSTSWCQDSTEKFSVNIDGTTKKKQCSWLRESKNTRCALEGVSDYCPVTCDSCHCKDNPGKFLAKDLTEQTCQWVSEKLSRCNNQPLAEFNCPLTCGKCTDIASMTPSTTPSTAPSTESPSVTPSTSPSFSLVNISEKVQIQMGPLVNGALMNEDSIDLLEDTLNASFNEETKSVYMNIRTTVENQVVTKLLSRRLVGGRQLQQLGDYVNFFDLIVTAQFRPTSTTSSLDANADIKEFFDSTTVNDKIIVALTNTTSSGAEYFRNVKSFKFIDTDTSQIGNQNDDSVAEPQSSNMMLIIISSASACAALIFILVIFMYTRKRHGRLTEATEQMGDAAVVTTNNASNATQNWEDLQPNQPYSIDVNRQDDGNNDGDDNTDAGRTFNTLEKIYSGESGDQMSFQSYGYSLDDGIVSKQSGPASLEEPSDPLGEFRSGFDSDGSDGPLDVSLSPANDSVYSGLTNEDASYRPMTREKKPSMNQDDVIDEENPFLHGETLYERVCIAPPGKLGVVIDTTKMGPVVYQVKDGSPLEGVVFPGDRIMAVDDIDTRGMTASNITKIMARKADSERRITVASKKEVY